MVVYSRGGCEGQHVWRNTEELRPPAAVWRLCLCRSTALPPTPLPAVVAHTTCGGDPRMLRNLQSLVEKERENMIGDIWKTD